MVLCFPMPISDLLAQSSTAECPVDDAVELRIKVFRHWRWCECVVEGVGKSADGLMGGASTDDGKWAGIFPQQLNNPHR